jgi:hypothetical protein
MFLEEAPWLWTACWRTDLQPEMMMAGFWRRTIANVFSDKDCLCTACSGAKSVQKQILIWPRRLCLWNSSGSKNRIFNSRLT